MAAGPLVWDQTGEREFETGTSKGVLFLQTEADTDGEYSNAVAWNGLTGVTLSPSGAEESAFYADNIKYAALRSAETFGFTIEAFQCPREFYPCDGSAEVVAGAYVGQQERIPFGFCYRSEIGNDTATKSDDGYKLHIIYGATASPSERAYATINESPDAMTLSWECSTTPVSVAGYKAFSEITIDSTKIDAAVLTKIEETLYGKGTTAGKLPSPAAMVTLLKTKVEV